MSTLIISVIETGTESGYLASLSLHEFPSPILYSSTLPERAPSLNGRAPPERARTLQ